MHDKTCKTTTARSKSGKKPGYPRCMSTPNDDTTAPTPNEAPCLVASCRVLSRAAPGGVPSCLGSVSRVSCRMCATRRYWLRSTTRHINTRHVAQHMLESMEISHNRSSYGWYCRPKCTFERHLITLAMRTQCSHT